MRRDATTKRKPLLSKLLSRFRGRPDGTLPSAAIGGKALGNFPASRSHGKRRDVIADTVEEPSPLSHVAHTSGAEASSMSDRSGGGRRSPSTLSRQRFSIYSSVDGASPDASIRPISPSSIAASSVASTPRTFKSTVSASTKPTTLFSVASDGGANRIAVSPSVRSRQDSSHARSPSLDSPGFSQSVYASTNGNDGGRPQSERTVSSEKGVSVLAAAVTFSHLPGTTIPNHSHPHPRNNPHPSSPPLDNASTLTLASSTFALHSSAFSAQHPMDEDASTRALAPSRRGSQDSADWSRRTASIRTTNTAGTGAAALEPGRAVVASSLRADGDDDASVTTALTTPANDTSDIDGDESALANEEPEGGEAEPGTLLSPTATSEEGTAHVVTPTKDVSDDQLDRTPAAVEVHV
jgi:hypothetical protein